MITTEYPFQPEDYTVLVVDDTAVNLKLLIDFLTELGFRTLAARNGESGIQRAIYGQPHIILLDVLMPDIDGFETCQRLKSLPETQQIPVIFMTALDDVQNKIRGFEVGGVDYITKPFEQAEVFVRLKTHLLNNELTRHLDQLVTRRTEALHASLDRERTLRKALDVSLQKERDLNVLKSRIIEAVNHEFRTPLTVINQVVWFLTKKFDQIDRAKILTLMERVEKSSEMISELLSSLEMTKALSEDQIEGTWEEITGRVLCEELEFLITQFGDDTTQITYQFHDSILSVDFYVDRRALQFVVRELMRNALKFASRGPISTAAKMDGDWLVISVQDQGIGVPPEEHERIFEAFYRGSNVDAHRGLGMGLFLARQMVDVLGGTLQVGESEPGATFVLRMPRMPSDQPTVETDVDLLRLETVTNGS